MAETEQGHSSKNVPQLNLNHEQQDISNDPTQEVKITDFPIDLLVIIFENLELNDLLNVADSNKQLKQAADFIFDRKYGKKLINLKPHKSNCILEEYLPDQFTGVRNCLRFIRCFGQSISVLRICADSDYCVKQCSAKVWDYVERYCTTCSFILMAKHTPCEEAQFCCGSDDFNDYY